MFSVWVVSPHFQKLQFQRELSDIEVQYAASLHEVDRDNYVCLNFIDIFDFQIISQQVHKEKIHGTVILNVYNFELSTQYTENSIFSL